MTSPDICCSSGNFVALPNEQRSLIAKRLPAIGCDFNNFVAPKKQECRKRESGMKAEVPFGGPV
jgi:hypothetical protein